LRHNISVLRQGFITEYDPGRGVSISTLAYEYPRGFQVPEHAHGSDQLVYAIRGVMEVSAGPSMWLIPPHFGMWIPARTFHSIKEFRYTLELFRPVYGTELEERLDSLRKLQRYLGEMNDCVAGLKLLKQMGGPADTIKQLKRRRDSRLLAFQRYWEKFNADGEGDSWMNYLASP
jgi:hypothetical protein